MTEIKKRFNIDKLGMKSILLLVLLLAVVSIGRALNIRVGGINTVQAQSCWTPPGVSDCSDCGGDVPPPPEPSDCIGCYDSDCYFDCIG